MVLISVRRPALRIALGDRNIYQGYCPCPRALLVRSSLLAALKSFPQLIVAWNSDLRVQTLVGIGYVITHWA